MELRHLRCFVATAKCQSYSEASRRIRLAQSAISRTILDLEDQIGVRLFVRTNRNIRLTPAGAAFLAEAQDLLRRAEEAQNVARRTARCETGRLRIGFLHPVTGSMLPALIRDYRDRFPEVEVHLDLMSPDQQIAALTDNWIDVGMSRPIPREQRKGFFERTLYEDTLALVLPTDHPLAGQRKIRLEKMKGEPFVQFHRVGAPCLADEVAATCRRHGFSPRIVTECNTMQTVVQYVESGLGVSLLPSCARYLLRQAAVFLPLADPGAPMPFCAAWRKASDNPALPGFLEVLWEHQPRFVEKMKFPPSRKP